MSNTISFNFFYTKGYAFNADIRYEYELKDGKYYASIKPYEVSEEDKTTKEVDKEFIIKVEEILNKYEVYKWNGFNKSDNDVLDGDSFSLSVSTEEETISASGYMSYPDNYLKVKNELDILFEELL